MNKYTKLVSFDIGTERPTTEYCEKLEAENEKLQDTIKALEEIIECLIKASDELEKALEGNNNASRKLY